MLDWFYGGRDDVDPFRMAGAGYAAEARWMAEDDVTTRDITEELVEDFTPDFLQDPSQKTQEQPESDKTEETTDWSTDLDDRDNVFEMSDAPHGTDDMLPIAEEAEPMAMAASKTATVNGDDRDYDWLLPPRMAAEESMLQANDTVEMSDGQQGVVSEVNPDGSFTVDHPSGGDSRQKTTYGGEAIDSGEVKRSNPGGSVVEPVPGGALYS